MKNSNLSKSIARTSHLWKKASSYEKNILSENSLLLNTLSFKECIYYLDLLSSLDSMKSEYSPYIFSQIFSSED